jgi:hypothetical protein
MILRNLLYFIAVLLFIGWILAFKVWKHEGHMVHVLLGLAVISLVLAIMQKPVKDVD